MVLEEGSRCYISNRRHPCYGCGGKIASIDSSNIALVVLREVLNYKIMLNIHTHYLHEDESPYFGNKIEMYYDNSRIPKIMRDYHVRLERMNSAEEEAILTDYESEEEIESGQCSLCGGFGPLGTICVTSQCEDSGNIYSGTNLFSESDSDE